ncbi:hypothetical protein LLB_0049 [Legionella longbeachae D-4968]|nr:hypothetical protein LLB_0049 [Legionella longbeachae D-4968]
MALLGLLPKENSSELPHKSSIIQLIYVIQRYQLKYRRCFNLTFV